MRTLTGGKTDILYRSYPRGGREQLENRKFCDDFPRFTRHVRLLQLKLLHSMGEPVNLWTRLFCILWPNIAKWLRVACTQMRIQFACKFKYYTSLILVSEIKPNNPVTITDNKQYQTYSIKISFFTRSIPPKLLFCINHHYIRLRLTLSVFLAK